MTKIQNTPNRAAFDTRSAEDLKTQFQKDPKAGLKAAAQQFETLFLQQVLKSMRDTVPQDDMLSSDQSRFYTGLLDQQMAQNMATSGNGLGFAKLIEQQLGRNLANQEGAVQQLGNAAANAAASSLPLNVSDARHLQYKEVASSVPTSAAYPATTTVTSAMASTESAAGNPGEFVNRLWSDAVDASRSTGIPPQFMVAQAALETGWGKSEIRRADGTPSYNLFGVKAGKNWSGAVVDAKTTEYVNGQAQQSVEPFRAYNSYSEAFQDYAALLRNNPRYASVIGSQDGTEFAKRLQQAGYATDPMYADKLSKIINGPTLRQALIG